MEKKQMIHLHELVRKLTSLISPVTYEDTLQDLMSQPAEDVFKGDFKKCVIPWNIGSQQLHLPVCNRFGMIDPQMIEFSKKMVNKYKSVGEQHDEETMIILTKLDKLYKRFNKDIPKPQDRAAQHAQMTKFRNRVLQNIKGHLS